MQWVAWYSKTSTSWEEFLTRLNNWGNLKWTTTGFTWSLEFLNNQNRLEFKTNRKKKNLNIYLHRNSAHPPDIIRGIIVGHVQAYYLNNMHYKDFVNECTTLARNFIHCGWKWKQLSSHLTDVFNILTKQGKNNLLNAAMKSHLVKKKRPPSPLLIAY